jgi:hypothetical protein
MHCKILDYSLKTYMFTLVTYNSLKSSQVGINIPSRFANSSSLSALFMVFFYPRVHVCCIVIKLNLACKFLLSNFWLIFFIKVLKNLKIAKNNENPKNMFFHIFTSFLSFSAYASQKNLSFKRSFELVQKLL